MTQDFLPDGLQKFLRKYTSWKSAGFIAIVALLLIAVFAEFWGRLIAKIVDWAIAYPFESIVVFWLIVLTICVVTLGQRLREKSPEPPAQAEQKPRSPPAIKLDDLLAEECFIMRFAGVISDYTELSSTHSRILKALELNDRQLPYGAIMHMIEKLRSKKFVQTAPNEEYWKFTELGRAFYYAHKDEIRKKSESNNIWESFRIS